MTHDSWREIEGWLSDAEGNQLQKLAAGKFVLELGTYYGRSTVCMASVADLVVTVDTHVGAADIGFKDTLATFLANIKRHGVSDWVVAVVSDHAKICSIFRQGEWDLVFIDGDHSRAAVERDTDAAHVLLRPGGVIAWHDWGHPKYPGVKAAIEGMGWRAADVIDTLAWKVMKDD